MCLLISWVFARPCKHGHDDAAQCARVALPVLAISPTPRWSCSLRSAVHYSLSARWRLLSAQPPHAAMPAERPLALSHSSTDDVRKITPGWARTTSRSTDAVPSTALVTANRCRDRLVAGPPKSEQSKSSSHRPTASHTTRLDIPSHAFGTVRRSCRKQMQL